MTEKELSAARTLSVSAHVLIPLIEDLHTQSYDKLLASFRGGEKDNLPLVAECNAYRTILEEIRYKLNNLEIHYKKENS